MDLSFNYSKFETIIDCGWKKNQNVPVGADSINFIRQFEFLVYPAVHHEYNLVMQRDWVNSKY